MAAILNMGDTTVKVGFDRVGSHVLVASATMHLLALLTLAVLVPPAAGQDRVVLHGRVLDSSTQEPVPGVQVVAPLSELSAVTDSSGGFEISFIQDTHYELVTTAMGYQPSRVTLGPEAEELAVAIELRSDQEAMASLATLQDGLEQRRRRRRTRRLEVIDNVALGLSDAATAFSLVRELAVAQPCGDLRRLCRLGRPVRLCIDDVGPIADARELEAYSPSDLWLIEVYQEGREVRVYSRWFIDQVIRTREGELRRIPIC